MPGNSTVCVGRLRDTSERENFLKEKKKIGRGVMFIQDLLQCWKSLLYFFHFNHTVGDVI